MSPSRTARQKFAILTAKLGQTFALKDIRELIETNRNKSLLIEKDILPVTVTGYVVFLRDVDLICTRTGLDDVLEASACAHEMAHILLHEHFVPKHDVLYSEFIQNRHGYIKLYRKPNFKLHRNSAYEKIYEQEAEILGRHIVDVLFKIQNNSSDMVRKLFG